VAYSAHVWNQLKSITAGELAKALERDAWAKDTQGGSMYIFRKPNQDGTSRRVSIHFHPQKTYGPRLLKDLFDDIGWSEADLRRLKLVK
jgi:predicted RNA binding protein YcfA (HicA-like mRNA interferase family)